VLQRHITEIEDLVVLRELIHRTGTSSSWKAPAAETVASERNYSRLPPRLSTRYDLEKSRAAAKTGAGWQPDIWRGFADEVGILGAALPEEVGGIGGGPVEDEWVVRGSKIVAMSAPIATHLLSCTAGRA
jgi:hypothetical protein